MIRAGSIPEALRAVPQWIGWKAAPKDDGGTTKLPVAPATGQVHDAHDPGIWTSLEWALAALESFRYLAGIGFVLTESDPFTGLDLDRSIGPDGQPEPWAQRVIDCFNSYTERSPSGTGIRIFVRATMPPKAGHKLNGQGPTGAGAIEIYDRKRYLTVTGDVLLARDVEPRQEELDAFCRMRMPRLGVDVDPGTVSELAPTGLSDDDVLGMARLAKNGTAFVKLFVHGDLSDHQGDPSRGDMALCNFLAFWAGGDAAQVDRIFRRSALMREKWDEKRGSTTYGAYTIAKVIGTTKATFHPTAGDDPAVVPGKRAPGEDPFRGLSDADMGIVRLRDVVEKSIQWLWKYRLESGGLALMAGDAGIGKSQILLAACALVTTGGTWPDGSGRAPLGNVVIVSAEDRPDQTIKPRLRAMGADIDRVTVLKAKYILRRPGKKPEVHFASFQDRDYWQDVFRRLDDVRLFVADPIPSYLGKGVNDSRNMEIRRVLEPFLHEVIEPRNICMWGNTHLNKSVDAKTPLHRITGSIAYGALPRNVHFVVRDAEDPARRYFKQAKCNNAPDDLHAIAFRVVRQEVIAPDGEVIETAIPVFEAETVAIDLGDTMAGSKAEKKKPVARDAALWLTERFRERREWRSKDLYQAAKDAGYAYNAVFKDNPQINAFPIRKWKDYSQEGKPWFWTAQGDWPDPPRPESTESTESIVVKPYDKTQFPTFGSSHTGPESSPGPSECTSRLLSDRDSTFGPDPSTFGPDLKTPESTKKDDLPIPYVDTFGTFGTFGSNFVNPSAQEGEGGLGRALRYLAGTLRLDQELSRPHILEWALKNGISESDLLGAAERLGVTRTLDGTTELWRLHDQL